MRAIEESWTTRRGPVIRGIGVDVVEVSRISRLLDRFGERAERRLFTPSERERCRGCPNVAECYAARFAAKEAVLKALGTGLAGGITWQDLQVDSPGGGTPPSIRLEGRARDRLQALVGPAGTFHLTLSHEAGLAVAVAVVEAPLDTPG